MIPFQAAGRNLSCNHQPLLPSNIVRWDATAIENLRENLHGRRERTPSIIDSDDDYLYGDELLLDHLDVTKIQEAAFGHRSRMGYSPGLDSIISSDEDMPIRWRVDPSSNAVNVSSRNVMAESCSYIQQRFFATDPKQVPSRRDWPSDDIISDGESEKDEGNDLSRKRKEKSSPTPVQQFLMFRRQAFNDGQDIIDDETDPESVYSHIGLPEGACEANGGPSKHSRRFSPKAAPIARNSSMFSILSSSGENPELSRKTAIDDVRQIKPPTTVLLQSGSDPHHSTGQDCLRLSRSDQVKEETSGSMQERSYIARVDEAPGKRARNSFGSIISDTSYMSGIVEDS